MHLLFVEVQRWLTQTHTCIQTFKKTKNKRKTKGESGQSGSEQQVGDGGEQLGQPGLNVVRLSDGVAAEIEALQPGAGGQRLQICQRGDVCTSELKRESRSGHVGERAASDWSQPPGAAPVPLENSEELV